jgi:AraC-like DNA-binding protein
MPEATAYFDQARKEFTPYGLRCEIWTPTEMPRPDRHNEIEINLLREGTLTYLFGGRKEVVPARQVTVFWAGMPHQIIECTSTESYFVVTLPLPWFLQCHLPQPFVQRILHGDLLSHPESPGCSHGSDVELFTRWQEELPAAETEVEHIALLEIEARLRRLARSVPATREIAGAAVPGEALVLRGDAPTAMEQVAAFIAQHYTEPLTIDTISRSVNLHPNYAMTLFRRTFGVTLTTYLAENRVAHAQRLLVMTDGSILEIALESGFGSLSRFNTAFKTVSGCTPRDYRKIHRRGRR